MNVENTLRGIRSWSEDDRPREKMLHKGAGSLSNAELLAILLATGTKHYTAVDLAKQLLQLCDNQLTVLGKKDIKELSAMVSGVGTAKAIAIAAALELGKRHACEQPAEVAIKSSAQAAAMFKPMLVDLTHEEFWVLLLNRTNKPITKFRVGLGGVHQTPVDCRMILKQAVVHLASGIVLCHNHPSGSCFPSQVDKMLTRNIVESAKLLDIKVLDHIIIAGNNYYSFSDENTLDV
ncbi:MAG: DNA repair protein RadC [Paludibacteraceae bacterium]|nr:DNA repair protein RadC [Paludibacteraceae bacterium]